MYTPPHFRETRPEWLHGLIGAHPLATVAVVSSGGLEATHIPLLLRDGVLIGHVARANPIAGMAGAPALAVFQGAEHYVSPSWYASKASEPRVVPTWNYIAVHVHGALRTFDDRDRLLEIVTALTNQFETPRTNPWSVSDAPLEFVEKLLNAITGIEIPVERMEGKWKVSQNRPAGDRESTANALAGHPMGAAIKAAL